MSTNFEILKLWEEETYLAESIADFARAGVIDEVIRRTVEHTLVVGKLKALGEEALTLTEQENDK